MVIKLSLSIAENLNVNMDMVYATAAYHDTGLVKENKNHNITSGNIVREDMWLRDWFTEQQIETIAQAVEDHYMASGNEPRNIYGKIIARQTPWSTAMIGFYVDCDNRRVIPIYIVNTILHHCGNVMSLFYHYPGIYLDMKINYDICPASAGAKPVECDDSGVDIMASEI